MDFIYEILAKRGGREGSFYARLMTDAAFRDSLPPHILDDGGAKKAGFLSGPWQQDCACRALAIACEIPYRDVYNELTVMAAVNLFIAQPVGRPSVRRGVDNHVSDDFLREHGFHWSAEFPKTGRAVADGCGHLCAIVDGTFHDTIRCDPSLIYGYWVL